MSTGKVVLGTLAGIAVGAAIGVLMAPDKGSETRKKIMKKQGELTDGLKDKYESLKDKYNTAIDGAANKLESFAQKGDDLSKTAQNTVSNAKSTITR